MSDFIVRVQLSNEKQSNYTLLRDRLLAQGFTKRITAADGSEYRLPNGNYRINTKSNARDILTIVQKVALTVDRSPQIVVTEAVPKGVAWVGLERTN